jgi:ribose transport system permease protein
MWPSLVARARQQAGRALAGAQGSLLVLVALVAVFALVAPGFFTLSNTDTLARQGAILAIVTLGMTLVIITGGIDLSVGAVVALTAVVFGLLARQGWPLPVAIVAALATAAACGFANGWLSAYVGLPPFVATLGIMGVARGLALVLADGRPITGLDRGLLDALNGQVLGIPVGLGAVVGLGGLTHALLAHTRWGVGLLALGGNRQGARLAGLPVHRDECLVYLYAGVLAGIAGFLTLGRMDVAHPLAGSGLEFDAIAAAVIGGTALEGGRGSAAGALLGAAFITVLRNGLGILGASLYVQLLVVGLVIVGAFALDYLAGRRQPLAGTA